MADMMEYKCPSCGGAMEFDSMTQKMKCPYCDTEMEVAQYQQMQEKAEGNAGGNQGGDAGENNENWSIGNNKRNETGRDRRNQGLCLSVLWRRDRCRCQYRRNKLSVLWKQGCHERTVCRRSETRLYHSA